MTFIMQPLYDAIRNVLINKIHVLTCLIDFEKKNEKWFQMELYNELSTGGNYQEVRIEYPYPFDVLYQNQGGNKGSKYCDIWFKDSQNNEHYIEIKMIIINQSINQQVNKLMDDFVKLNDSTIGMKHRNVICIVYPYIHTNRNWQCCLKIIDKHVSQRHDVCSIPINHALINQVKVLVYDFDLY